MEFPFLGGDEPAKLPDLGEQGLGVQRGFAPYLRENLLDLGHGQAGELLVGLDPLLLDEKAVLEFLGGVLVEDAVHLALPARVLAALLVDPPVLPAGNGPRAGARLLGYLPEGLVLQPEPESLLAILRVRLPHRIPFPGGTGG